MGFGLEIVVIGPLTGENENDADHITACQSCIEKFNGAKVI
jgi:hypothetical protein